MTSRPPSGSTPPALPEDRDLLPWISSPLWRRVLDVVPAGLVAVDADGHIVYWNPYAELVLGIGAGDAIGRHFRDTFCPSLPLDRCWVSQAIGAAAPRRNHRFTLEHPSGEQLLLDGDLTPFTDGLGRVQGAIVSVRAADTPNAETDELRQQLARIDDARSAILGSVADGLYTVDREFRITSFNRAAERLTGLREQDVLGRVCRHVLHTDRCADGCPLAITLENHQNQYDRDVVLRADADERRSVTVNTAVLRSDAGEPIGGVVTFRDADRAATQAPPPRTPCFEGMVGRHKSMRTVYQLIDEVADSDANILILGESGTGKGCVADALVRRSRRHDKPCVKVSCSVLPDTLLESELFGHVRGAFTDAREDRVGRFLHAHGGTVFLDEIGDISPAAQLKLLRVIEEQAFEPVGSSQTVHVDVRIIAATHRDLPRLVEEGRFRQDLYYRLNVIPIHLPPLRERRPDIPELVDHFVARFASSTERRIDGVSPQALAALRAYDFPGNVRELENAIEHAFARTRDGIIDLDRLPLAIRQAAGRSAAADGDDRSRVLQALEEARWQRDVAAQRLGISRTTLWRRMKAYGLDGTAGA